MKIYRVEHKDMRIGPYQVIQFKMGERYFDSMTCPGPYEDGLIGMRFTEFSGFQCMRHLVNWFRLRDIFKLKKKGFRVYKYAVNPHYVRLGGKQLVFQKQYAYSRTEVKLTALARHVCMARLAS